ncbi:adenylyl-sulfate kinase 3-like isoform X2 [Ziziphus jujuba]|uniref:Adenylyl-sulfate kinase 3-like isoform X2 n=1 Tax=Ziziphus jujuba TaxID=326968 RepID=A0ABM4A442_ZIZJJ|nr:adenylyl-sulfate kinase 3-like isoform X2 [Ziziphus jujuba]
MCCIDYGSQQIRKKFTGKSTLAYTVSRELHSKGKLSYVLDGDNLRHGLNKNLGFKPEDRTENIRRVGMFLSMDFLKNMEIVKFQFKLSLQITLTRHKQILISPYRKDRDACRAMLPDSNFIEVFMNMPLELCKLRDAKGLYKLARAGKIKEEEDKMMMMMINGEEKQQLAV